MKYTTEDWARMFIAGRLKVPIKGKRKSQQWHEIVTRMVNTLDHYDAILDELSLLDERNDH